MQIRNASLRLRIAARVCRCAPPGISGRLARWLYPERLSALEGNAVSATSSLGRVVYAYPQLDMIARLCMVRGFYAIANVVIARTICGPGDSMIEVGANIGSETLLYGQIVQPGGKVYAFEPVPRNVATLRALMVANHLDTIELMEQAVSDVAGRLAFRLPPCALNSGEGSLATEMDADGPITVESTTLDLFAEKTDLSRVRLVMMDAQGAETKILVGGEKHLRNHRPCIMCEAAANWLERQGSSQEQLLGLLQDLGYELWRIDKWGLVRFEPKRNPDILAIPRGPDAAPLARRISSRMKQAMLFPPIRGINPAVVS